MTTPANIQITNAWVHRTLPDIFYEEPEPDGDGMLEDVALQNVAYLLEDYYRDREDVFIGARGKIFVSYDRSNGNARVAPDLFIAFGVPAAVIRQNLPNYWVWETGKAPGLVIEAASKTTASNDLGHKRRLYERLGIAEYWRFDVSPGAEFYGQPLAGDRLVDGQYVPCELRVEANGAARGHSELLGLDFHWSEATGFDVLDPATGRTIDRMIAKAARLAAERDARLAAETQRNSERDARLVAETQRDAERDARLAAEEHARRLEDELQRLREGR